MIRRPPNCMIISLPLFSFISFNASYGDVEWKQNSSVSIVGNNAVIVGSSGLSAISYFQSESTVPDTHVLTLEYQGFGSTGGNGGEMTLLAVEGTEGMQMSRKC